MPRVKNDKSGLGGHSRDENSAVCHLDAVRRQEPGSARSDHVGEKSRGKIEADYKRRSWRSRMAQARQRNEAERRDKVGSGRSRADSRIRQGRVLAATVEHHNRQLECCECASDQLFFRGVSVVGRSTAAVKGAKYVQV